LTAAETFSHSLGRERLFPVSNKRVNSFLVESSMVGHFYVVADIVGIARYIQDAYEMKKPYPLKWVGLYRNF
jgi:hypothetical protein